MARRRQSPQAKASSLIFENGKEAHDKLFDLIIKDSNLNGQQPLQAGANRWLLNSVITVKDIWGPLPDVNLHAYPANRWRRYLNDYVGPDGVDRLRFRMRMGFKTGDSFWYSHQKEHPKSMWPHNEKGNCFLGLTFRTKPQPGVAMLSRTVQYAPMGALDLSFGILLAREFSKITNKSTPPTFTWMVPSIWIAPFYAVIMTAKLGYARGMIRRDDTQYTVRKKEARERYGNWPARHYLDLPPDAEETIDRFELDILKTIKEFIEADDYDTKRGIGARYQQYERFQKKLRQWLYQEEQTPWKPHLPTEWFSDMYAMKEKDAKNANFLKEEFPRMEKTDFPRGAPLQPWVSYEEQTKEEFIIR